MQTFCLHPKDLASLLSLWTVFTAICLLWNANSLFVPISYCHAYREIMDFAEYRLLLGAHLQGIRKSRGLTQEQVAECLGMDRVSIGYIEQGKRTPKLSTLYALSKCYDVAMSELFKF